MPEVRGLFNKKVGYNPKNSDSIKIMTEINELKDINYELIYEKLSNVYELYFEMKNTLYCIQIPKDAINSTDIIRTLFKYEDHTYKYVNITSLGQNIYKLCIKLPGIIKNDTSERIKFLLKQ